MFALANLYRSADNCSRQGPGVRSEETSSCSSLGDDHRRANHDSSFVQEPDSHDHFSQSLRNTDLCRPS